MDPRARNPGSPLYLLERSDVGLVQLDRALCVVAMNSFARRVLPVEDKQPFDKMVLSFHPENSQSKVRFLLDQTECPVSNPPPMTMIINIPERVLLIKVSKMADLHGETAGYLLVFYDITEQVMREEPAGRAAGTAGAAAGCPADVAGAFAAAAGAFATAAGAFPAAAGGSDASAASARSAMHTTASAAPPKRQLQKIPTVVGNRIILVDASAVRYVRAEGHYTWVHTAQGSSFCNLAIGDLEARLAAGSFMRIHRSYVANLDHAEQILRDDGKVALKLAGGDDGTLPVARAAVPKLLERLGLTEALG